MDKKQSRLIPSELSDIVYSFFRWFLFQVLSVGPMPRHMAFILDGNRRYGKKKGLKEGEAHHRGFYRLMTVLQYCYEMGVQFVTIYAFSIDNFNRSPAEVRLLMGLLKEKMQLMIEDSSVVNKFGIRVIFLGRLELLDEPIREAAAEVMTATEKNSRLVLLVSIAYASTDEIVHGVQEACREEWSRERSGGRSSGQVTVKSLEKKMYFTGQPDPDILIRTSGESRLSNFLLWQTAGCLLYAPRCLWPEISLWHLVWAVLQFQRSYSYLQRIKRKASKSEAAAAGCSSTA